ncbi:hypothetical protein AC578_4129 [Pseudocercospora eumusae]|uniref:Uncharacterized protein n=1 Tax=Pseudocercospora eumusae TaxID=321146 RepID=A0A139HF49_9PEZI|nr:hypothetical protein AC578_4129 [Pseudocercospora eumusae]
MDVIFQDVFSRSLESAREEILVGDGKEKLCCAEAKQRDLSPRPMPSCELQVRGLHQHSRSMAKARGAHRLVFIFFSHLRADFSVAAKNCFAPLNKPPASSVKMSLSTPTSSRICLSRRPTAIAMKRDETNTACRGCAPLNVLQLPSAASAPVQSSRGLPEEESRNEDGCLVGRVDGEGGTVSATPCFSRDYRRRLDTSFHVTSRMREHGPIWRLKGGRSSVLHAVYTLFAFPAQSLGEVWTQPTGIRHSTGLISGLMLTLHILVSISHTKHHRVLHEVSHHKWD